MWSGLWAWGRRWGGGGEVGYWSCLFTSVSLGVWRELIDRKEGMKFLHK